ncbi:hypothetical protein [Oceanicella sp. SM1341]|uniref:hypothetical protein n=1 Tax=Oceanicella sp. SM1341 TaxID=1548889 RepID=UPI0013009EF1|nr:hypothetical protein [Oceanicella sp. SM1341]
MPEDYSDGNCRYQARAQPFLGAIALAVRDDRAVIPFLLLGTPFFAEYAEALPLWQEQWLRRDPANSMKCPFWSNYWYEPCPGCTCRSNDSVSMEIDAMFFLRAPSGRTLAVHVEMKRDAEVFSLGQAEAYRPRAECFQADRRPRKGLLPHEDFITVLFCGTGTDLARAARHFDRVITHGEAHRQIASYPMR